MDTLQRSHTNTLSWPTSAPLTGTRARATTLVAAAVATLQRLTARPPVAERMTAVEAIDLESASTVLGAAIYEASNLEIDWLWYASRVRTVGERRYCLQRALAINPHNDLVRHALTALPPRPAA